jgi:inner membrane protein
VPFLGSHSVAGLALGTTPFRDSVPRRIWWLAPLCAAIPDLDTLWSFGMRGSQAWYAHRGITHSPAFAVVLAFLVLRAAFPHRSSAAELQRRIWLALFLATVSHGLLDALSYYGPGIPFLFPFSTARFKFAWLPIRASPSAYGHGVVRLLLKSIGPELVWIWIPSLALLGLTALRRRGSPQGR